MTDTNISELNIFISCTEGMFVNMSLEKENGKCLVYYCYGSPDTREDGQLRHPAEMFDTLTESVDKFVHKEIETALPDNFKFKIGFTTADGATEEYTGIDRNAFMELLMEISNNIEEFAFVNGFRYYL